jgi:hypothetical protein
MPLFTLCVSLYVYSFYSEPNADCLNSFHLHSQLYPKLFKFIMDNKQFTHTHTPARMHICKATNVITLFSIVTFSVVQKVHGIPVNVVTTYNPSRPVRDILTLPALLQEIRTSTTKLLTTRTVKVPRPYKTARKVTVCVLKFYAPD